MALRDKKVLLVITGGIAAYKSLDLIRQLRQAGVVVRCVLTAAAEHLVAPLSVAALSEHPVARDLFSLTEESEMGHIRLAREADVVVVAPATANILAKMATGLADDLASTVLLATDRPVLVAPAMNTVMWQHPATRENLETLQDRGVHVVGPADGDLACGETGAGRMVEPSEIVAAFSAIIAPRKDLVGCRALVTSGPTHEPIDPVRYIANRSSGKQGHAIATALAAFGAETILVSGPTSLPDPAAVRTVHVRSAEEMLTACTGALPVDVAVCAAAVSDWRIAHPAAAKVKKEGGSPPGLELVETPDILATLAGAKRDRPALVVGFAAETDNLLANADHKRTQKGCDWILANDVSAGTDTFGGDRNTVHFVTESVREAWPTMTKTEVAERLAERIAAVFANHPGRTT